MGTSEDGFSPKRFGERVRAIRKQLGLSLDELAGATRIDPADLSRIENGRGPDNLGAQRIHRLAQALKVRPGTLLDPHPRRVA